jgi:polyhydroxyalkanoate synthesis regulator phasin
MLDTVRRYVRERFGRLAPNGTEDLPRTLVRQGRATKEQATRVARDLVGWSKKNTEVVAGLVRREVRQQIARLGVATKEEVTALRKRLKDLEVGRTRPKRASSRPAPKAKASTAKRASKKTAARRSGAKKSAAKKTSAKRPAARKTSRRARRA